MEKTDIVPDLKKKIEDEFKDLVKKDRALSSILNRKGRPAYENAYDYAQRIAELQLQAFQKYLSKGALPNDQMYFNIAERVIPESLKNCFDLISEQCSDTAEKQNSASRIGMKPHQAQFDKDLSDGLVEAVSGKSTEEALKVLERTVETNCLKVVDTYIRKEAELHSRAGLHPQISRMVGGAKPCKRCKGLAGRYNYPKGTPGLVFQRHENCRCVVEYWPGDGRSQNAHTKEWKTASDNEVTPQELEEKVSKQQRVFHAGPKAAEIREKIIDSGANRTTEVMEQIVDLKMQHPDSAIIDLMVDGTVSPNMNYQNSGRHIRNRAGLKDADAFDETKSEILATAQEIDKIVSEYIGTGELKRIRSSIRETIHIDELSGIINGEVTHKFMIIHSATGWHVVPAKENF